LGFSDILNLNIIFMDLILIYKIKILMKFNLIFKFIKILISELICYSGKSSNELQIWSFWCFLSGMYGKSYVHNRKTFEEQWNL